MKPVTSFFDIINCVFEKQRPTPEEIEKHTSQWMCNNLLSCDMATLPVAVMLSSAKLSNYEYFEFLWNFFPRQKKFIRYSAQKSKADKETKYIMDFYKCSQETAKSYAQLISKDEMNKIIEFFECRGVKK